MPLAPRKILLTRIALRGQCLAWQVHMQKSQYHRGEWSGIHPLWSDFCGKEHHPPENFGPWKKAGHCFGVGLLPWHCPPPGLAKSNCQHGPLGFAPLCLGTLAQAIGRQLGKKKKQETNLCRKKAWLLWVHGLEIGLTMALRFAKWSSHTNVWTIAFVCTFGYVLWLWQNG